MEVVCDRSFHFDAARPQLWALMADVLHYQERWPWLRRFEAGALDAGQAWACVVQPPLPYRLSFQIHIGEVRDAELVTASITGDLVGEARLDLLDDSPGCRARLRSHLAPATRVLRLAGRVAAPAVRFGHDWVLETGARQFAEALTPGLGRAPEQPGSRSGSPRRPPRLTKR